MRLTLSVVLALLLIILFSVGPIYSGCPQCDVTYPPMTGAGPAPNGATLAQIYITDSWNVDANGNSISGTNSNIWNAVVGYHDTNVNMNGATEMWNNATSNGNHINHYFQVNQSIFSHTDILIFRGNPEGGCADISFDAANGVWMMRVADAVKNLPHDWIAAIIASFVAGHQSQWFSEPGELLRLQTVGIKVLELEYKASKYTDKFGNQYRYRAKVKDTNQAQTGRWAWDVFLVAGP